MNLGVLLNTAASKGRSKEVRQLIYNGACVNSMGFLGNNALHLASMNGHIKVCKTLLNLGIKVDSRNKVGKTALHLAAVNGHQDIVYCLINSGAQVNACDMLDMTPLHWACDRGHLTVAKVLLQFGADVNHQNKFFKSPKYIASEKGFSSITELINVMSLNEHSKNSLEMTEELLLETYSEDMESLSSSSSTLNTTEDSCSLSPNDGFELGSRRASEFVCSSPLREESIEEMNKKEVDGCDSDENKGEEKEAATNIEEEPRKSGRSRSSNDLDDTFDVENMIQDHLIESLNELEAAPPQFDSNSGNGFEHAAGELLKAQASLLTLEDSSKMLSRAVFLGRTLQLTEAGARALEMIRPDPFVIPNEEKKKKEEEEKKRKERVSVPKEAECNAVVLRNKDVPELLNELVEACALTYNLEGNGPPKKKYRH